MDSANNRAIAVVEAALERATSGAVRAEQVDSRPPLDLVHVTYGDTVAALALRWVGDGYPSEVRRALDELGLLGLPPDVTPVVVARRISSGSRALLAEHDVSWADARGGIDVRARPGLFVVHAAEPAASRPGPDRFTPTTSALAEFILQRATHDDVATPPVEGLAETLGISAAAASTGLQLFDRRGWTTKTGPARGPGSGRVLREPGALLDAWAEAHAGAEVDAIGAQAFIRDGLAWLSDTFTATWESHAWALTGLLALELRAPFSTTTNPIDIYVDDSSLRRGPALTSRLSAAGLVPADTGVRVRLLPAGRFTLRLAELSEPDRTDVPLVSDIRLYGDLLRSGGVRAAESARHLRETRIPF
ncbi:hypothetical protein [Cellulomonas sp. HZM]|uniref:hypothetical protein n=1 Tax=Cellulomonas sp. HZM TaxID=1454010 RepID=UPI0012DE82CB|nr:hypothetical protein [Cellulomonas sp. HZM]